MKNWCNPPKNWCNPLRRSVTVSSSLAKECFVLTKECWLLARIESQSSIYHHVFNRYRSSMGQTIGGILFSSKTSLSLPCTNRDTPIFVFFTQSKCHNHHSASLLQATYRTDLTQHKSGNSSKSHSFMKLTQLSASHTTHASRFSQPNSTMQLYAP